MIHNSATASIKRAQKESLLLKEISAMFHSIWMEDKRVEGLFVNRVELSTDKGWVTVFFYTLEGQEKFAEQLEVLKLYKPSIRKTLAAKIRGRYVPDLRFAYDATFEKQQRLESAMSKAAQEVEKYENSTLDENDDEDAA
jgi:ribosome-binding factor A